VREFWSSNLGPVESYTVQRYKWFITASTSTLSTLLSAMTRRWTPQTRYTLRRNTANIMKVLR